MADIFLTSDATKLLKNKHITFFGDSNIRAQYKDLIWLLNHNSLISQNDLRAKQSAPLVGEKLIKRSNTYGREFEEQRLYEKDGIHVDYYFITQCFSHIIEEFLEDIHLDIQKAPDVIFINSTLWDVTRWGPNGVTKFKENLVKLAKTLKGSLPPSTLVIWGTALPIAPKIDSALLVKQINFLEKSLRFDVMEANLFARQVMVSYGHDVLDNHFYMRMQIHRRVKDGVHFFNKGIRFLTNLLLTHIALTWDVLLPNQISTLLLEKSKQLGVVEENQPETVMPTTPKALKSKTKNGKYRNQRIVNRRRQNRVQQCNRQQSLHSAVREPSRTQQINRMPPQVWMHPTQPAWDRDEDFSINQNIPSLFDNSDMVEYTSRMRFLHNQRFQPY